MHPSSPARSSLDRAAVPAAVGAALCSIAYAVVFLGVVPVDQRSGSADAFFRSYLTDGAGAWQLSWLLLAAAGLLSTVVIVALQQRLAARVAWAGWACAVGFAGAVLTACHAVAELAGTAELAERWKNGDTAARAAVAVSYGLPSAIDPRGFAAFGMAGLFWLILGLALRGERGVASPLPQLSIAGGVLLIALFIGSAFEIDALILISGGIVSLVIGPAWWLLVARQLGGASVEPAVALPAGATR